MPNVASEDATRGLLTPYHMKVALTVARGVRTEDEVCRIFSGDGSRYCPRAEDALFQLVEAGLLSWDESVVRHGEYLRRYEEEVIIYAPTRKLAKLILEAA